MWKNITFKWLSIVARFLAWYSENRLNNYWSHRPRSSRTSHSIDKPLFIRWWPGLFVFTIWYATELKKNIWGEGSHLDPPNIYTMVTPLLRVSYRGNLRCEPNLVGIRFSSVNPEFLSVSSPFLKWKRCINRLFHSFFRYIHLLHVFPFCRLSKKWKWHVLL